MNAFYPTLDSILHDLELHFGDKQKQAVQLGHIIPGCMSFSDKKKDNADTQWEQIDMALRNYHGIVSEPTIVLKSEFVLWRQKWQWVPACERPTSAITVLNHCQQFPSIRMLLQLLGTLLITKTERTASAIRATVEQDCLEALLLLQVHREHTPATESVIDRFAVTAPCHLRLYICMAFYANCKLF